MGLAPGSGKISRREAVTRLATGRPSAQRDRVTPAMKRFISSLPRLLATGFLLGFGGRLRADDAMGPTAAQVSELIGQNRQLAEQVRAQQAVIEKLNAEMAEMREASERHERTLRSLQDQAEGSAPPPAAATAGGPTIRISGEAGLGFFRTGPGGQFPNSEFRVDDAKVLIEARVWKNAYAVAELDLATREASDEAFHLGEFYADFENVSELWDADRVLNVRIGRFNIPFGEEYQVRGVLDNPLISHAVSDLWGIDEGVEVYGEAGGFRYVVAVQNGGRSALHDFDSDKAVTARLSYDPRSWLHLSASALRTGRLSAQNDKMSELWFGGGFFRALGAPATTTTFRANLYEADGAVRWKQGQLKAAAGWVRFDDDDRAGDHARAMRYHFVEAVQQLTEKLYGVVRYSEIRAPRGYPLVGLGNFGNYFFGGSLTETLRRTSLGFGYRLGPPLVLKLEYSFEQRRMAAGEGRENEDLLALELALKF